MGTNLIMDDDIKTLIDAEEIMRCCEKNGFELGLEILEFHMEKHDGIEVKVIDRVELKEISIAQEVYDEIKENIQDRIG